MFFGFAADSLQLDVVAIGKQREPSLQTPLGIACTIGDNQLPDISGDTGGECNQAIDIAFEPVLPQHRHASRLAFAIASRYKPAERSVASVSLAKQYETGRLIEHLVAAHPQIHADDRFDPSRLGRTIELYQGKKIALLGDGTSRHARRGHRFHQ
jgi:hypothetical protein